MLFIKSNNSTLFDNYISYLLDSINSPVFVDDSARTSDGQLIEIPSSDEEEDEYLPRQRLIHHDISSDSSDDEQQPPALETVIVIDNIENTVRCYITKNPLTLDSIQESVSNQDLRRQFVKMGEDDALEFLSIKFNSTT